MISRKESFLRLEQKIELDSSFDLNKLTKMNLTSKHRRGKKMIFQV